jgi:hypothetical protein
LDKQNQEIIRLEEEVSEEELLDLVDQYRKK